MPARYGRDARKRIADVGGAEHAREHRQFAAAETEVVAGAVEPLVVRRGRVREVSEAAGATEDLARGDRVPAHDPELVVGERAGLVQNQARHTELADVVQERRAPNLADLLARIAHDLGDRHTRRGDAARMLKGPRRLRVDDQRECLRHAIEAVLVGDQHACPPARPARVCAGPSSSASARQNSSSDRMARKRVDEIRIEPACPCASVAMSYAGLARRRLLKNTSTVCARPRMRARSGIWSPLSA